MGNSPAQELRERVLNQLPVGVWVAQAPSGEVVYTNEAFREIMGIGASAGVNIAQAPAVYGIRDRGGAPYPVDLLPFSRVLATDGPVMVDDLVIHRPDGRRVAVRAFAAPLRNSTGVIEYVSIAFIDISTEVAAISHGRAVQTRLTFAINHAPLILFTVRHDGRVTLSEGAGLSALGFRPGQLVGRDVFDIYRDSVAPDDMQKALHGESVTNTLDVGGVVLETHLNPVRDDAGKIIEVIGISVDVTTQRRLQANVIQNDRLMAMGTLAASVAHEINNPLTYILGNLERMEDQLGQLKALLATTDDASAQLVELQDMVRIVREGAMRVQGVAQDLRSFMRHEDETIAPVDLRAVIGVVLQLVRKELSAHATLDLRLSPVPFVSANEGRLVQVILNLLVNAWQALPDPDPQRHRITLAARTEEGGGWVLVEISDTGPGVPVALRQRIFEPFFTTKGVGGGSGLGLFVCHNIVAALGGSLSVDDAPGGGAVFRLRLRAAPAKGASLAGPGEARAAKLPGPDTDRSGKAGNVLVIDDDELVAATLVNSLRGEFDVRALNDAEEALAVLLSDARVDLVFCDLMMKGLTGMDIHERLQQAAPERLPALVFMTGGAFTARAAEFVEQRADAVVYKPFSILEETHRRLAGRARAEAQRGS